MARPTRKELYRKAVAFTMRNTENSTLNQEFKEGLIEAMYLYYQEKYEYIPKLSDDQVKVMGDIEYKADSFTDGVDN